MFANQEDYASAKARVNFINSQTYPPGHPTLEERDELVKMITAWDKAVLMEAAKQRGEEIPKEKRTVTVGYGTDQQRELELGEAILCHLKYPNKKIIGVHGVKEDGSFILQIDTETEDSDGNKFMQQQGMWLSREAFVGLLAICDMFLNLSDIPKWGADQNLSNRDYLIKLLADDPNTEFQITDGINPEKKMRSEIKTKEEKSPGDAITAFTGLFEQLKKTGVLPYEKYTGSKDKGMVPDDDPRIKLAEKGMMRERGGYKPKGVSTKDLYRMEMSMLDQDTSLGAAAKAVIKKDLERRYNISLDDDTPF